MFPRKKAPLPVALVRWYDASTDTENHNINDMVDEQLPRMVTVGFLALDNRDGITLVTDIQLEDEYDDMNTRIKHFIPRGIIHDVTILRK
jgi:hypothetical protein